MTRLASILGIAVVATLVLLSGCESAVKTTDYAKKLEGTWEGSIKRQAPPVLSEVTAEVTRTDTNKGDVSLTISSGPIGAPSEMREMTKVSGSIEVTATEIKVSGVVIDPPNPVLAQGLTQGLTLTYKLSDDDNKVTVGNAELFPVLLGSMDIMLTKQMGSDG